MNKTKLILAIFFCFLSGVLIVGCVKDMGKLPVTAPVSACDTVTYTKHIKPIIDASCISCHGTTPQPGAPVLSDYNSVKANGANGKIKATVFDAKPELMPQGGQPLPQAQKDLITCWLNNGMKE